MNIPTSIPLPKMPSINKTKEGSNICVLHKGPLSDDVYTCKCGAKMCYDCAVKRKASKFNRLCPVCSSVIMIKTKSSKGK